jgi:hypothetical protein
MYDTILVKLDGAPTDRPIIEVQASDWSSGSHYFLFADNPSRVSASASNSCA